MFSKEQCPGCNSTTTAVVERIQASEIIERYESGGLNTPVQRLFSAPQARDVLLCECGNCQLRWYADAPSGDGAFYEALQQHDWYYQSDKPEYGFAAKAIKETDRVLEIGCGRGAFASFLPKTVAYRGLEFNDAAVDAARKVGLDVEKRDLHRFAAEHPASVDVVCHFQVLEHVEEPLRFMRSAAAAIRPGGRMIVAVPAEDSFIGMAESSVLNMPPHHLTRWTDQALSNVLTNVGLRVTDIWHEEVAAYHTYWHARVLVMAGLRDLLGSKPKQISGAGFDVAARALYRVPGVRGMLVKRGRAANSFSDRGHTVCAVATKPLN